MKEGAKAGSLKLLSDDEVRRIHAAAVSLLENPGVHSDSTLFLDIFKKSGAKVDRESGVIQAQP